MRGLRARGCGAIALLVAGAVAGCGAAPEPASYPIIPAERRTVAANFDGISGRGGFSSVATGAGWVLLVGFDIPGSIAPKAQLAQLRATYLDLRRRGVRLLRVTPSGRDLVAPHVAVQGRLIELPLLPQAELVAQIDRLNRAGLAYSLIVDRQGRVAAQLIGTTDPARLTATVERVLLAGE